jgi:outer membrane protein OmpA-like peptidoglycan-associated protein
MQQSAMTSWPSLVTRVLGGLLALGLLASCTSAAPDGGESRQARESREAPVRSATPSPSGDSVVPAKVVEEECRPAPGRAVEQLADVAVPPVVVPAVEVAGRVLVEGFTVPAQVVDAGCVLRYDAPGGCLGAVEVTGATIPAATIPQSVVEESTLGDSVVAAKLFAAVTAPAVSVPGAYAPQVCRVERDGKLATVSRAGIVREGAARNGVARSGGVRPRQCDDSGCVPEVRVETVRLEPVRLPGVDVEPARLRSRKLPGEQDLDVLTGASGTAYVAPARVLFETDRAEIRPRAAAALRTIARRIRRGPPAGALLVEGHTDDRGAASYGLDLSERRAEAVADWLVTAAGFPRGVITTRGFGEAAPVVPNTSDANRQQNRRVVITVTR